jgi:hypothetical protein
MSYIAMAYFGMLPLGSLLIGTVSQQTGAPNAILCQGIIALIIAAVFSKYLRKNSLDKKNIKQLKEDEDVVMERI